MSEYVVTSNKFHRGDCFRLRRAKAHTVVPLQYIAQNVYPCRNCLPEMYAARIRAEVRSRWSYADWLDAAIAGNPYA
jgi:hypothetical protein